MAAKSPPGYGRNQRSRRGVKLFLAVVSANIAGLFAAVYVASYLRAGAGEPQLLLGFYYAAIGLAAVIDALWLDELLFKGAFWRSLQGRTGRFAGKRDAVEDLAAGMKHRSTTSFPVLVLVCALLTYGLFNIVNRGFTRWWRDIGQHAHILRDSGSSAQAQVDAILELSMRQRPEVLAILETELGDDEPQVAAFAAWAIGRHKENPAMNRKRLPALVAAVRGAPPQVRREAMIALGRLQHQAVADELREALNRELAGGGDVDPRLVWALGYLQHPDSLALLDAALYHPDGDIQRLAAWALAQHRDSGRGRDAADLLEQRLPAAPMASKCAIVHGLGIVADERSNLALIHAYNSASPEQRATLCERISVYIAPDGEHDREDLLMPQEVFAMKILQALGAMRATSPEIRAKVEPWLRQLIASEATQPLIRESAASLLRGIQHQRNDRSSAP